MKIMENRKTLFFCLAMLVLVFTTGCQTKNETKNPSKENVQNSDPYSGSQGCVNISLQEMKDQKISVASEAISDINLAETDAYAKINNNMINENFIFSHKKGFLYMGEKEGAESAVYYDNGNGKITEQNIPGQPVYVRDDAIYYNEAGSLKCNTNGKIETIAKFQYSEWNSLFLADKYIYYTDINENGKKSYIYRVDYQGSQTEKLYTFDVNIDQIYLYKNELWFVFHDFDDTTQNGLGRVNRSDNDVAVYEDIAPKGTSEAGNKISIVNDYVYFNSSGFKRLNIQNNSVEELFPENVEGVNFTEDCILFYKNKTLYRRDSQGVKKIRKLKGKTAGFEGIRVENDKIYVQSYEGAFGNRIEEIDGRGERVKNIYEK